MMSLPARLTDPLRERPLLVQGVVWSLVLHAVAVAAAWLAGPAIADPYRLSGQRQVVQIEAAFCEPQPRELVEVTSDQPLESPRETADDQRPPPRELPDASPATLPASRPDVARPAPASSVPTRLDAVVEAELPPPRPQTAAQRSEPPERHRPPETLAARPPRQRRSATPAPASQPAIELTATQLVGWDDQQPPDLSSNRPPAYPAEAVRRRLEGTVLLRLWISAAGEVERVEVVRSSGHGILDRSAVEAVSSWRGQPARRGGRSVEAVEVLPIRFRL